MTFLLSLIPSMSIVISLIIQDCSVLLLILRNLAHGPEQTFLEGGRGSVCHIQFTPLLRHLPMYPTVKCVFFDGWDFVWFILISVVLDISSTCSINGCCMNGRSRKVGLSFAGPFSSSCILNDRSCSLFEGTRAQRIDFLLAFVLFPDFLLI